MTIEELRQSIRAVFPDAGTFVDALNLWCVWMNKRLSGNSFVNPIERDLFRSCVEIAQASQKNMQHQSEQPVPALPGDTSSHVNET